MPNSRTILSALLLMVFTAGCMPTGRLAAVDDSPPTMDAAAETPVTQQTSTPLPTTVASPVGTVAPTAMPSLTPTPFARVTAVNGNLFIRRGPGTEYDRIGLLKNGASAVVIGRDVLSKWVQVQIPETESTGWVSLQTPFSALAGDLDSVPSFTFTDWPELAYIKNCTEHDLIIMPNELYLYSLWTNPQYLNQAQIDPGYYEVRDASLPGEPLIQRVDIKEGDMIYITMNGLEEYHNCPENN